MGEHSGQKVGCGESISVVRLNRDRRALTWFVFNTRVSVRGGDWFQAASSGLFAALMDNSPTAVNTHIGGAVSFTCARASFRSGDWNGGSLSGRSALNDNYAPTNSASNIGGRCFHFCVMRAGADQRRWVHLCNACGALCNVHGYLAIKWTYQRRRAFLLFVYCMRGRRSEVVTGIMEIRLAVSGCKWIPSQHQPESAGAAFDLFTHLLILRS